MSMNLETEIATLKAQREQFVQEAQSTINRFDGAISHLEHMFRRETEEAQPAEEPQEDSEAEPTPLRSDQPA